MNPLHIDPMSFVRQRWERAKKDGDPNARYCTLATVEMAAPQIPRMRTLVLRQVDDQGCTLFVNRHSQKGLFSLNDYAGELLLFYPSLMEQYRLRGQWQLMPEEEIAHHWQNKPRGSKLLDLYYSRHHAQSTSIPSRAELEQAMQDLSDEFPKEDAIPFPRDALGLQLIPTYIETWSAAHEGIHHRALYQKVKGEWLHESIVP